MDLEQLKQQGLVWNFDQQQPFLRQATGYAALDDLLLGGWPAHDVIEVISPHFCGENRLFWPWLLQQQGLRFWINPPSPLYGAALPESIRPYCLQVDTKSTADALWATEQCLQSGRAAAVFLWTNEALNISQAKKLQLAASHGQTPLMLFSQPRPHYLPLPLSLSLELQPRAEGLQIHVKKLKGARSGSSCLMPWQQLYPALPLSPVVSQANRWHQASGL